MKKAIFGYLLVFFLALQGRPHLAEHPTDSVTRKLNTAVNTAKRYLNRRAVICYLYYLYPSLVQLIGTLTLDTPEELQFLEDIISVATI